MKKLLIAMSCLFSLSAHAEFHQVRAVVAEREYFFVGNDRAEIFNDCLVALELEELTLPIAVLSRSHQWLELSQIEIKDLQQVCLLIEQLYNKSP